MEVKKGDKVKVHYTGKFTDDTVFDTSEGREPLQFEVGQQQVIPGFESAMEGMKKGDKKSVTIEAANAYGPHHDHLVLNVDRAQMPGEIELAMGMQLEMSQEDGQPVIVTVTGLTEDKVTLDANHPLAGKDLIFDIELVEILSS